MANVKLHIKEQPVLELLQPYLTGRRMYVDFDDFIRQAPIEPSRHPEIMDWKVHETFEERNEVVMRLTMGVRLYKNGALERDAYRSFSQYLYAPLLDDLNAIEGLILDGNSRQALAHLDALKAHLCGMSYG